MFSRRCSLIAALLATAALLLGMPGLLRCAAPPDSNRMNARLRPEKARTLTVWLLPGRMEDERLLRRAAAAFEKETPGVRVFLRRAVMDECTAPQAVLPDVMLFETAAVTIPEKLFVPLEGADPSGTHAGVGYAAALWLDPWVLSIPSVWLNASAAETAPPRSLLSAPAQELSEPAQGPLCEIPWGQLCRPGALQRPEGTALMQLLSMCPPALRKALIAPAAPAPTPAPTNQGWSTSAPRSRGKASPTPRPAPPARVQTLGQHLSAVEKGEALCCCVLTPAVSDCVRYGALCRDGKDARAFLSFLRTGMAAEALAHGRLCLHASAPAQGACAQAAQELFAAGYALPNAFAHTREALTSLCLNAFMRNADPVETLLRLR